MPRVRAQDVEPGTGNIRIRFQLEEAGTDPEQLDGTWSTVERECNGELKNRTQSFSIDAREWGLQPVVPFMPVTLSRSLALVLVPALQTRGQRLHEC